MSTPNRTAVNREFGATASPNQTPRMTSKHMPKPRQGTRDITIGPPVESHQIDMQTKHIFDKEIWVSGLHPSLTANDMCDFIVNNTDVSSKDDFKCTISVKKDCDVSKLSYVSFKLDVKDSQFDHLMEPSTWPKTVRVREFIKHEAAKLNELTKHAEKQWKIDEQKNVSAAKSE